MRSPIVIPDGCRFQSNPPLNQSCRPLSVCHVLVGLMYIPCTLSTPLEILIKQPNKLEDLLTTFHVPGSFTTTSMLECWVSLAKVSERNCRWLFSMVQVLLSRVSRMNRMSRFHRSSASITPSIHPFFPPTFNEPILIGSLFCFLLFFGLILTYLRRVSCSVLRPLL